MSRKIAFFSKDLRLGGIEKVFVDYANFLSKDDDIYFILVNEDGGLIPLVNPQIKKVVLSTNQIRRSFFSLVRVLKKNRFDVVISGSESCNILLALANCLIPQKSLIITSQHSFFNTDTSQLIHDYLLPWALKKSAFTLCVSKGIRDMLVGMGLNPSKLEVVYNPVNREQIIGLSKTGSNNLGQYLVFVGRLYEVKNIPFLLKSFCIFKETHPDFKLVLVGDGPEKENLIEYAGRLNVQDSLIWTGEKSNPYPYIRNSEILILPSLSESLSNVVLEALCLGKTVVSTPCVGPVEILNAPFFGYISESFDNCVEFAKLMSYAVEHKLPSPRLENYSAQFDVSISATRISTLINNLLSSSTSSE